MGNPQQRRCVRFYWRRGVAMKIKKAIQDKLYDYHNLSTDKVKQTHQGETYSFIFMPKEKSYLLFCECRALVYIQNRLFVVNYALYRANYEEIWDISEPLIECECVDKDKEKLWNSIKRKRKL